MEFTSDCYSYLKTARFSDADAAHTERCRYFPAETDRRPCKFNRLLFKIKLWAGGPPSMEKPL